MTAVSAFAFLLPGGSIADRAGDDHLARAIREARRGVGRTAPNPPVGAVVERDGNVVGVGHHVKAGERHGEIVALDACSCTVEGATLYVTLEPCVHHGRTPPCVERIIKEKVGRVVIGAIDPNPRVHEKGVAALRAAGIEVVVVNDALADEARALIAPFARGIGGRPYVVLKIATTLDGKVATANGASRWITGPDSRALVHKLRDAVDAVVVGAGTVLADDPELTVRVDVAWRPSRNPRRVVIDPSLRTPADARAFARREGELPAVLIHDADRVPNGRVDVETVAVPSRDLLAALKELGKRSIHSVLVEAGPALATEFIRAGLVDELWWITAPTILGQDALGAIAPLNLSAPADGPRFAPIHRAVLGDDAIVVLKPLA